MKKSHNLSFVRVRNFGAIAHAQIHSLSMSGSGAICLFGGSEH